MFNVSIVFSIILSFIIGIQIKQGVFLLGIRNKQINKLSRERVNISAVMNLITTIYIIFTIIYAWIELGFITLTAILYVLLIIVSFMAGINYNILIQHKNNINNNNREGNNNGTNSAANR